MTADELIKAEIARQNRMWGNLEKRIDNANGYIANGEMRCAATAQLEALDTKILRQSLGRPAGGCFLPDAVTYWPENWSGMRDYGSDVANLVVAAAWLTQEIDRLILAGADTTRTSRNIETQPFDGDKQPNPTMPDTAPPDEFFAMARKPDGEA